MNKFYKVSLEEYSKSRQGVLNVEKELDDIIKPIRKTKHSAGYDFHAPFDFTLKAGESIKFATGIKVEIDENSFLAIVPRSSLGFKYRLQLDNIVGIIDCDYFDNEDNEGHIFVKLTNDSRDNKTLEIKKGEAFAQGIFLQYGITEDDNVTNKRNGGIGSTDKKK